MSLTRRTAAFAIAALPAVAHAADPPAAQSFKGFDGAPMAVRTLGDGRPTLLLHGFLSNGASWFRTGLADRLVAQGRRVIAPDFRGHGASAMPEDRSAYPKDALCQDQEALLKALSIREYDLVGYSMGALVAVRMLVRGARPGKLLLGGMGDARIMGVTPRDEAFRDGAANGANAKTEQARGVGAAITRGGMKGPAISGVLASLGRTSPAELKRLTTPTLVVCGDQDNDNGVAEPLAAALGNARAVRVPGTHGGVPATAAFAEQVTAFLGRA